MNTMANNTAQTKMESKNGAKQLKDLEYTVEASRTVPDGDHEGTISDVQLVERGEEGFRYLDVYVKENASGVEIKAGYAAAKVTPETDLGHLLQRFGADVSEGSTVRPLSFMKERVGAAVNFATTTERNKNGRFARVTLDSLQPAN